MKELRLFAALSGLFNTGRLLLCGGIVTLFLLFGMSYSYANDVPSGSEQVQTPTPEQQVTTAETTLSAAELELTTVVIPASAAVSSDIEVQEAITTASESIVEAETAIDNVNTAITVVEQKEAIVVTAQATLTTEQQELTAIQDAPLGSMTYTTDGYVAPEAPETPTVTTTVLPSMGDDSTKINVPFDIKMGDTIFEGQGSVSQIYVSSKAIISFGGPDWTFYDWPNATQDGIYVFQSDYTSFGTGAGITVTTTETTLSIDWNVHRWGDLNGPLTNISWDMTVNPTTGEWTGVGTIDGNTDVYGGPRTGVRQDGVLEQQTVYTSSNKQQAISAQQVVVSGAQSSLTTAQTNLTNAENALASAIEIMDNKVETAVAAVATAKSVVEDARYVSSNAPTYSNITFEPSEPVEPVDPVDPGTEPPTEPTEPQQPGEGTDTPGEEPSDPNPSGEQTSEEGEQPASEGEGQESPSEESPSDTTTSESTIENALADGELTAEEKTAIAEALLAEAAGDAISAETLAEAGLTYSDLPPATPVEVRVDENGNPVIIEAEVAAALQLFEDPGALISGALSCLLPVKTDEEFTEEQKCQVLTALANIGADMSPQEREEAEKMVIAAIIASGAALNAVSLATSGSAPSSGGSSGGGGPSGDSKGVRRRRP